MAELTMIQAITQALDQALEKDENTLIFGEDVGVNGGVFRATDGLHEKYGEERVFDTPLAESAIGGLAIGLTLENYRPIMEIQFFGFVFEVMDSLAAQMSRTRFRMGNTRSMPVTIRSPFGGGVHTPALHADSLESLMAHTPGIRVVIPSNPYDAKGLLLASIESNDPVVYLEHMRLYRSFKEEVPSEYYTIDLDKANVVLEGNDVTLVTYGYMVQEAKKVAATLAEENISVEVIDLRTISPIDVETILKSVEKTGRLVVVQEAQRQAGVAATIIAEVAERAILNLKAPIGRVASPDSVYPFGLAEHDWLPNANDIIEAIKEVMNFDE
ncbi:MAG: alpha-ketoacid dehydrogenase subunit beta [Erysipelothrix sp.]|jgi:pyruvate dehydrogenase E1 component beta subunit|nr:alpha-ketoacid dehydrogenase subunit beta [Erysipelothrix sp.]